MKERAAAKAPESFFSASEHTHQQYLSNRRRPREKIKRFIRKAEHAGLAGITAVAIFKTADNIVTNITEPSTLATIVMQHTKTPLEERNKLTFVVGGYNTENSLKDAKILNLGGSGRVAALKFSSEGVEPEQDAHLLNKIIDKFHIKHLVFIGLSTGGNVIRAMYRYINWRANGGVQNDEEIDVGTPITRSDMKSRILGYIPLIKLWGYGIFEKFIGDFYTNFENNTVSSPPQDCQQLESLDPIQEFKTVVDGLQTEASTDLDESQLEIDDSNTVLKTAEDLEIGKPKEIVYFGSTGDSTVKYKTAEAHMQEAVNIENRKEEKSVRLMVALKGGVRRLNEPTKYVAITLKNIPHADVPGYPKDYHELVYLASQDQITSLRIFAESVTPHTCRPTPTIADSNQPLHLH